MAIKEILDRIKTALGADASAELTALLADANREATDILDTLSSANRESASRKAKIRELESELEAKRSEMEAAPDRKKEIDALKAKADQYDALVANEQKKVLASWQDAKSKLDAIKDSDKRYSRVSAVNGKFKTAAEGAELDADAARYNLDIYETLLAAGGLDEPQAPDPYSRSTSGGGAPKTSADALLNLSKQQG